MKEWTYDINQTKAQIQYQKISKILKNEVSKSHLLSNFKTQNWPCLVFKIFCPITHTRNLTSDSNLPDYPTLLTLVLFTKLQII